MDFSSFLSIEGSLFYDLWDRATMQDTNFVIKIADLLKNTWSKDAVHLEKKFSKEIKTSDEGISATVRLMWLNDSSVLVTLTDIKATVHKECDRCTAWYTDEAYIEELVLKGVVPTGEEDFIGEENEHCIINTNESSIDLHDPIVHAIKFCDHVVNHCPDCAKIVASLDDETSSEIGWWPIIWKKS